MFYKWSGNLYEEGYLKRRLTKTRAAFDKYHIVNKKILIFRGLYAETLLLC